MQNSGQDAQNLTGEEKLDYESEMLKLDIAVHALKLERLDETRRRARHSPFLERCPGRMRELEFTAPWRKFFKNV